MDNKLGSYAFLFYMTGMFTHTLFLCPSMRNMSYRIPKEKEKEKKEHVIEEYAFYCDVAWQLPYHTSYFVQCSDFLG